MKREYEAPEFEVEIFDITSTICTSGGDTAAFEEVGS